MSGYQRAQDPNDTTIPADYPNNSPTPTQSWSPPTFHQTFNFQSSQYPTIAQGNYFSPGSAQVSGYQASNAGHYPGPQSPRITPQQSYYQTSANDANQVPQGYSPVPQASYAPSGYPDLSDVGTYSDYSVPGIDSKAYGSEAVNPIPQYTIEPGPGTYDHVVLVSTLSSLTCP